MTVEARIEHFLCSNSGIGYTDSELQSHLGIKNHAQVNVACRALVAKGVIARHKVAGSPNRNYCMSGHAARAGSQTGPLTPSSPQPQTPGSGFTLALDATERLRQVLDVAWQILFDRIANGLQEINKEASLQMHLGIVTQSVGGLFTTAQGERFQTLLEVDGGGPKKSIDLTCSLGDSKAAVELKCFRKKSNRAADTDMYDVLKDVERLESYVGFNTRRLICLTDNSYYANGKHEGLVASVSLRNGTKYSANFTVNPAWAGRWKDKKRDKPIHLIHGVECSWVEMNGWFYLMVDV